MISTSISAAGSTPPSRRREADPAGDSPFDSAIRAGSYARFSSSLQSEKSNADQQRECREMAQRNGHRILPELEFVDEAVSGTKRERTGLNALLAAAENGELHVLYFHSLSRLSRESVITLPLLKSLVHKHDVRVISVTDNIDSDKTGWELIAHLMAIVHEHYITDLAANVLRGQEGTLLEGFSVGDGCFGYTSAPVAESETGRRGRNAKPHKIYVIDPDHAAWVKQIFHWFVVERRSLRWITRELNRLGAPKDHRATTDSWRHQYLPRLLRNRKYTGQWPWGEKRNVRDPLTGKVSQKDRKPEECESWVRDFPHLRLIDDATFAEADQLLMENEKRYKGHRKAKGTLRGAKSRAAHQHPRHLLSGLIRCRECGSTLNVGGSGGKYLFCPSYAQGNCTCKTQLRRDLAERMILDEIGRRILRDPIWREAVLDATRRYWRQQEAQLPSELAAATKALADVERRIANLVNFVENGTEAPELAAQFRKRRAERKQLAARVERLRRTNDDRRPEPTEAWVNEQLDNLGKAFAEKTPAAAHALRDLVGGAIVVTEIRQPGRKRHYLRGRFTITTKALIAGLVGNIDTGAEDSQSVPSDVAEEIVIDFREPPEIDALSVRAKELYDEGLLSVQIAKELGRAPSYVTKLAKHWFASHGQEMPDGHARRATLSQKQLEPPLYQAIADDVMALYCRGVLLQDIAERLKVDRNTITSTIRWWHETRDLPIPDGRSRRKQLAQKTSPKADRVDDQPLPKSAETGPKKSLKET